MTKADRAILIKNVVEISERLTQILDILIPSDEECVHPPHAIEHEESMDDEPTPYRCVLCGREQDHPFHE